LGESAEPVWWILDYKTSHGSGANLNSVAGRETFFEEHRKQHEEQLAVYARVLRALQEAGASGEGPEKPQPEIRLGIYYPRLLLMDWWKG